MVITFKPNDLCRVNGMHIARCRVVFNKSYCFCCSLRDPSSCASGKKVESDLRPLPAGPQPPLVFASCHLLFSRCGSALESNATSSSRALPQPGMNALFSPLACQMPSLSPGPRQVTPLAWSFSDAAKEGSRLHLSYPHSTVTRP